MNRSELISFFSQFDFKSKGIYLYYRKKEEWSLIPKFNQNGAISIILDDKIIEWYNIVNTSFFRIAYTLKGYHSNNFDRAFNSISPRSDKSIEINVFSHGIMLVYSSILVEGTSRTTNTINVYTDYYFKTEELKKIINQEHIQLSVSFVSIDDLTNIYKYKTAEELQIKDKTQDQIIIENLLNSKLSNNEFEYDESEDFIYNKRELNIRIRNRQLVTALKFLYDNVCQICDISIKINDNKNYSEIHHLKPIGGEHKGNDSSSNMICVCPNCHVKLDYGTIEIKSETFRVIKHEISIENIEYHNKNIYQR